MSKTWLWTPAVLVLVATLSYGLFVGLRPPDLPSGLLYGNGHIEGTEVRISAEGSGRVMESRLVEGASVARDDLLVRLDDAMPRAVLAKAEAELEAIRQEQALIRQELAVWRHHRETAESDTARYRTLRQRGVITPQQLNEAENRLKEAQGRVGVLEARLSQTEANLVAAQRQIDLLRLQLEKTEIRAPIAGTVLAKGIEMGELATAGRLVAVLVDLSRLELKVYIPQRDIGKIRLGDPAQVRIDAFPERYFEATVARVDQRAQFTPRDIHMPEERVRTVFGVTLAIENPEGYLKPGMPADAWIRLDPEAAWPDRLTVPR